MLRAHLTVSHGRQTDTGGLDCRFSCISQFAQVYLGSQEWTTGGPVGTTSGRPECNFPVIGCSSVTN